jgi:hypothetical protein
MLGRHFTTELYPLFFVCVFLRQGFAMHPRLAPRLTKTVLIVDDNVCVLGWGREQGLLRTELSGQITPVKEFSLC